MLSKMVTKLLSCSLRITLFTTTKMLLTLHSQLSYTLDILLTYARPYMCFLTLTSSSIQMKKTHMQIFVTLDLKCKSKLYNHRIRLAQKKYLWLIIKSWILTLKTYKVPPIFQSFWLSQTFISRLIQKQSNAKSTIMIFKSLLVISKEVVATNTIEKWTISK